jgi:hypothetical protein
MTKTLAVGGTEYRLIAAQREDQWIAHAVRLDNGDRFGVECAGATESDAVARLVGWLMWQREHAAALDALQAAERAYHQAVAASAFAEPSDGVEGVELQHESLAALDHARERLDEIRGRKP